LPEAAQLEFVCGWKDSVPASYAGVELTCPSCGARIRVPSFGHRDASDIDIEVMNRLLGRTAQDAPGVSVYFRPLFLGAVVFAALAGSTALLLVRPMVPDAVAIAGGAAAWPLGILVAWIGQRRYVKQVRKRAVKDGS
jgi:hypothetical protein